VLEREARDLVKVIADPAPEDERLACLGESVDHDDTISLVIRTSVRIPT
jgi:hypothetical protein